MSSVEPEIPRYPAGEVPETLASRPELAARGLAPGGPVRGHRTGHGRPVPLYAVDEAMPKRAVAKKVPPCPRCGETRAAADRCWRCEVEDASRAQLRGEVAGWARDLLADPELRLFAVEETPRDRLFGRLTRVAVVGAGGQPLLDTAVSPPATADPLAERVVPEVGAAPFAEVARQLGALLAGRQVVVHGLRRVRDLLGYELDRHHLRDDPDGRPGFPWHPATAAWLDRPHWQDVAVWRAVWEASHGREYDHLTVPGGDGTPRGDALALRPLLTELAALARTS
ncbi:MAG: hypothetical protein ACJ73S_02705 [Mycobacteriales bacterium]